MDLVCTRLSTGSGCNLPFGRFVVGPYWPKICRPSWCSPSHHSHVRLRHRSLHGYFIGKLMTDLLLENIRLTLGSWHDDFRGRCGYLRTNFLGGHFRNGPYTETGFICGYPGVYNRAILPLRPLGPTDCVPCRLALVTERVHHLVNFGNQSWSGCRGQLVDGLYGC